MSQTEWRLRVASAWPEIQRLCTLGRFDSFDNLLRELDISTLSEGGRLDQTSVEEFFLFHDQFVRRQEAGIARGVPSMLITSLPRTASVFFTYCLADALSVPVWSVTHHSDRRLILASALDRFCRGGAVNHVHFFPSAYNIALLQRMPVTKILLRLRDPRDVMVSTFHKAAAEEGVQSPESVGRRDFAARLAEMIVFLKSWGSFNGGDGPGAGEDNVVRGHD